MPNSGRHIQLLKQIKQGNELAFETVFFKYYEELCKCAWKYVRSMDEAKGIAQDVFVEVWQNRKVLDASKNFRGYLFTLVKNKSLDYVKHQKVIDKYQKHVSSRQKMWKQTASRYGQATEDTLLNEHIYKAIEGLPPKVQRTFLLNREEGLTYQEVATYLNISIKTVESRMSKALKLLRARLSHLKVS